MVVFGFFFSFWFFFFLSGTLSFTVATSITFSSYIEFRRKAHGMTSGNATTKEKNETYDERFTPRSPHARAPRTSRFVFAAFTRSHVHDALFCFVLFFVSFSLPLAGRAGNCSNCRQKCVRLAYRNLCDGCAKKRKLCPGCMKPPELAELADGEGAPEDNDDEEGASTDEEDLDGVVITHLSDNEDDDGEDRNR